MDPKPPKQLMDARSVRFELAAMAVLLLGGYVFPHGFWVIPGLAVILAVGLGFGARANAFGRIFQLVLADRLKPAPASEPATDVRFSELFALLVLSLATLLYAMGASVLAWPIALAEAGICALHASTGISLETAVRDRLTGRGRK